ncbi:hypothetical protein DYQ86_15900 [Acidobacteria bacterium AB60]|nr:hypothetical protein DYQ86_15900 [Acidobacteria bacterium AB60]
MKVDIQKMQIALNRLGGYDTGKPFKAGGWLIATCGRALLAVEADQGEPYSGPKETLVTGALNLIRRNLGSAYLPLSDLRAIAKMPPDIPPCAQCKSVGRIYCAKCSGCGTVDCECDCGHEHERRCDECFGRGSRACRCGWPLHERTKSFLVVNGVAFDASLMGEYLFAVSAERFRFSTPLSNAAWVIGDEGWRLAIMPVNADAQQISESPKLTLEPRDEAA